jgi:hypothetical protein
MGISKFAVRNYRALQGFVLLHFQPVFLDPAATWSRRARVLMDTSCSCKELQSAGKDLCCCILQLRS